MYVVMKEVAISQILNLLEMNQSVCLSLSASTQVKRRNSFLYVSKLQQNTDILF